MAYILKLPETCPYCSLHAHYQLFDRYDKPAGVFCKAHAKLRKRDLDRGEEMFERRTPQHAGPHDDA